MNMFNLLTIHTNFNVMDGCSGCEGCVACVGCTAAGSWEYPQIDPEEW